MAEPNNPELIAGLYSAREIVDALRLKIQRISLPDGTKGQAGNCLDQLWRALTPGRE